MSETGVSFIEFARQFTKSAPLSGFQTDVLLSEGRRRLWRGGRYRFGGEYIRGVDYAHLEQQIAAAFSYEALASLCEEAAVRQASLSDEILLAYPIERVEEERTSPETHRVGLKARALYEQERAAASKESRTMRTFVFDMDGVIADIHLRLPWIDPSRSTGPNWDAFFSEEEMIRDKRHDVTVELMESLQRSGARIVILTARPVRTFDVTYRWLIENNVPFDNLFLRPDEDHLSQSAANWKQGELAWMKSEGDQIDGFFDDHPGNVKAACDIGIPGVLYDPGAVLRQRGGTR